MKIRSDANLEATGARTAHQRDWPDAATTDKPHVGGKRAAYR